MERRSFLLAFMGLAGSAVAGGLLMSKAEATPLTQLKNLVPEAPEDAGTDVLSQAPDGTAIEDAQYYAPGYRAPPPRHRAPPPRAYGRPYVRPYAPVRRPRRVRCRMVRNRRGRLVRVCS